MFIDLIMGNGSLVAVPTAIGVVSPPAAYMSSAERVFVA